MYDDMIPNQSIYKVCLTKICSVKSQAWRKDLLYSYYFDQPYNI